MSDTVPRVALSSLLHQGVPGAALRTALPTSLKMLTLPGRPASSRVCLGAAREDPAASDAEHARDVTFSARPSSAPQGASPSASRTP